MPPSIRARRRHGWRGAATNRRSLHHPLKLLYSDGSIEAQMPEGMMRFASIDELRAHLDQRP